MNNGSEKIKGDPADRIARDGRNEWGLNYTSSIPQEALNYEI